jgi:2-C-methyl-D-erythritol 4-phosphate cytidylyltransferase
MILHDAARPAVPYSDLDALMSASEKYDAAVLAAPIRSSLLELDEGGNVVAAHPPQRFMQLQTPQVYSRKVIDEIAASGKEPHPSRLSIVKGSPLNVRLGAPGESGFAKAMIAMLPKPKLRAASSPFEEAQW